MAATFGNYQLLTTSTTAQNKTDIKANLDALKALLPAEGSNAQPTSPDFNKIDPTVSQQLRNEIDALKAIITASP